MSIEIPAALKYRGAVARDYDMKRDSKASTIRDYNLVTAYIATLEPGASILDVPAGTGRFINDCLDHNLRYTGVDISDDMLRVAQSKIPADGAGEAVLQSGDARQLPFSSNSFDHLIAVKFIKWLPTLDVVTEVFTEFARVTRKNAFIQVTVWDDRPRKLDSFKKDALQYARRLMDALKRTIGSMKSARPYGGTRAYTDDEIRRAFYTAGFTVEDCVQAWPLHGWLKNGKRAQFYLVSKESKL